MLDVMAKLGFGENCRSIFYALLSFASTRILVNGVAGETIANRHGLRLGDPLSPFLSVAIMECFHHMIMCAPEEGLLTPHANQGQWQCTSVFADDNVTFLCPTARDIAITAAIIEDFGVASVLKTNLTKSETHLIWCAHDDEARVRNGLECAVQAILAPTWVYCSASGNQPRPNSNL